MMVGGFVWLLIFWGAMLVGSHDFLEVVLSGMALVMEKNSFPFLNKLILRSSVFLSSTVFEERHFVVMQFICLPCPRGSIERDIRT